jgi:uncharacterized membrane protein YbhN (UPF0104 family)
LYLLTRESARLAPAFAAVVYSRLVYWSSFAAVGIAFSRLDPSGLASQGGEAVLLAVVVTGLAGLVLVHAGPSLLLRVFDKLPARAARALGGIVSSIRRLPWRGRVVLWLLALAESLASIAAISMLASAVGISVGWQTFGWVSPLIAFATVPPITPFGLGVREGGLIVLLSPLGVAEASAVALALLMLARSFCLAAIGGLLEALRLLLVRREDR